MWIFHQHGFTTSLTSQFAGGELVLCLFSISLCDFERIGWLVVVLFFVNHNYILLRRIADLC